MATMSRRGQDQVAVHEDDVATQSGDSTEDETDEMDESKGPLEESGGTISDEDQDDVDDGVREDIVRFEQSFKNISRRFRLISRIGEGTFSTVYKAEDLLYDEYVNEWDLNSDKANKQHPPSNKHTAEQNRKPRYVAIKKIYVTSSPARILNELELLHDLKDSANVCPLITAFRDNDQVIAVLPFFQHKDFRDYYRDFTISDMRIYFHSLFTALSSVHEADIIHRDIKPTNFLYSPAQQKGVLVDFGLAEREGTDFHTCNCCLDVPDRKRKIATSIFGTREAAVRAGQQVPQRPMYAKDDQRPSRRANRAGTRGFRAPEVLLKCTAQTVLLDVWSCGIILLTFLTKRFPFFHSADDIDAFLELCTIYGKRRMKEVAILHGQVLQTNIPTVTENGHSWEKIVLWCTNRNKKDGQDGLSDEELEAINFMKGCLELDPTHRLTAEEALAHPWLAIDSETVSESGET